MLKVFSYGGGVQSTAALVLAAQGKIDYRVFLFANVGEDSENPATLAYYVHQAAPYAQAHGIELIEVRKRRRDGSNDTVYQRLTRPDSKSIGIPIRMSNGAPGNRTCTIDFKIEVIDQWIKAQLKIQEPSLGEVLYAAIMQKGLGIPARETLSEYTSSNEIRAIVGLGISLDEWQRMRTDSGKPWKRLEYPLIDLRLDRATCQEIIRQAGLPVPPKSSCWFCPFHSLRTWQEMRQQQPHLFAKAVQLERLINERRARIGRDQVWLTRKLKPLDLVTTDLTQASLFEETESDACESGYCMV